MRTDECLLCVKIPLGQAMIYTFNLFDDPEISKFIAIEAGELLKRAWEKDRFSMCGKSRIGFLAGAIYISALINKLKITQKDIADELDLSYVTVRNSYKRLLKIIPEYNIILEGLPRLDRSYLVQCDCCLNLPDSKDFEISVKKSVWSSNNYLIRFYKKCELNKNVHIRINNLGSLRKCAYFVRVKKRYLQSELRDIYNKILWELSTGTYQGKIEGD